MANDKNPKFKKDGSLDNRGRSEGSKSTQFGKNDGRPRPGRTRRSKDMKTIVERVRDMPVQLANGDTILTWEGMLMAQRKKALAGDTKAAQFLQEKFERFEVPRVDEKLIAQLLADDEAILAQARAKGLLPKIEEDPRDDS